MHTATLLTFIAIPLASVAAANNDGFYTRDASAYDDFEDNIDLNARDEFDLEYRDVADEHELIVRDDLYDNLVEGLDLYIRSEPTRDGHYYKRSLRDTFSRNKVDPQLARHTNMEYQTELANYEAHEHAPNFSTYYSGFLGRYRAMQERGCSMRTKSPDISAACENWDALYRQVIGTHKQQVASGSSGTASRANNIHRRGLMNKLGVKSAKDKSDPELTRAIEMVYQRVSSTFETHGKKDITLVANMLDASQITVDKWGCASKSKAADVAAACAKFGPLDKKITAAYKEWLFRNGR